MANACLFYKNMYHQFDFTSADCDFQPYQISSTFTKLQNLRRPDSEQGNFCQASKLADLSMTFKENID